MDQPSQSQDDSAPPPYDPEKVADALSRDRLSKYLARTGGNADRALTLYVWNAEVGAALTVVLSQVEIGLRNAIHRALADAFGPDWHRVARFRNAHPRVQAELDKAEGRLRKGSPSLPDIIAASDFNLWRELLRPAYGGIFWSKRIPLAFPSITLTGHERQILTALHARAELLQDLRNRIAHHEPIIGSNWEPIGAKLADRHREAVELLGWISPDLARWVLSRDHFAAVMAACPEPVGRVSRSSGGRA
ncbi:hypothetical protein [Muricoccus radiodurans]|uniref:hypothetical protein n=1 Tax=Muricoccus radiodurans TaxID=2231721 RepID=UPI003CEB7192